MSPISVNALLTGTLIQDLRICTVNMVGVQQVTLYFRPDQFTEDCRPPPPNILIFIKNIVLFLISDCRFSVSDKINIGKQAVQEVNVL